MPVYVILIDEFFINIQDYLLYIYILVPNLSYRVDIRDTANNPLKKEKTKMVTNYLCKNSHINTQ